MSRPRAPSPRRAFTLTELVVVIAILGVLAGLLLPAVSHLRDRGQEVAARKLMERLAAGVVAYLDRYPRLGPDDGGADFARRPWYYLHQVHLDNDDQPLLELPSGGLDGEAIRDPRTAGATTIGWVIDNRRARPDAPTAYTWRVAMTSGAQTPDQDDDLVYELLIHADPTRPDAVPGSWRWIEVDD